MNRGTKLVRILQNFVLNIFFTSLILQENSMHARLVAIFRKAKIERTGRKLALPTHFLTLSLSSS